MEMLCSLRSATEAQHQALAKAPERLQDFLDDEEDFGDAAGAKFLELDIGEMWHGLQYLMTGTAWEGTAPLDFLVLPRLLALLVAINIAGVRAAANAGVLLAIGKLLPLLLFIAIGALHVDASLAFEHGVVHDHGAEILGGADHQDTGGQERADC